MHSMPRTTERCLHTCTLALVDALEELSVILGLQIIAVDRLTT